ncbi:MAG: SPFH domain-containing protein [Lachnospiraceae bacterium]|uniref:SPFH domain-containing protein n=1 Tax=Galactobacillus timonensis TaxID=2041840 RepID=UPI0023EF9047|nr:SPFH domain-containing protein [Galactobacillus timonensis]MDD7086543.1 SPFH domain-containing protein [Galactobacillus timonensis]MDY5222588.1 SPFH domain-containing protein [Lachnospiraceae bacterium]
MGFIQAGINAVSSTLSDSWKDYFYCDALGADTIAEKALHKTKGFGSHSKDNIITDGSIVAVADGQCAIITEQGQVVDICAEPGEYTWDSSASPSLFTGSLASSVKGVFAEIGKRFTFGGSAAVDQRVYYFNTKEIPGLKYGTPNAVPFRVVDARAGIDIDIGVRCFGEYSIKVEDPVLFYTNVCGNVSAAYTVDQLADQLRTELLTALQPAFAAISAKGVRYSEVPAHTGELADALNEQLSKKWKDLRGIVIVSFGVSSISANEEDETMLKQMQRNAAYTNPALAAATLVGAQAQAMQDAAKNANGAVNSFMGVNMAQNAGGINVNSLYAQAADHTAGADAWFCPKCGTKNTGNFCSNCGTKKPQM